jgi:iron complex outermembrane recepter protein
MLMRHSFFFNAYDTRTRGIDVTGAYSAPLGDGTLNAFLGFNYNDNQIRRTFAPPVFAGRGDIGDILLSRRERLFVEGGAPEVKATLGIDWQVGKWNPAIRAIYYGPVRFANYAPSLPEDDLRYAGRVSADISLTYTFTENFRLTAGVNNVFDAFPTAQDPDATDTGYIYDPVQFGIGGAQWFMRVATKF